MSLYDRSYMRYNPAEPESGKASMVTTILVITIGVFVLQQVLNVFFPSIGGGPNYFLSDWFALSGQNFRELKVWTILSYALLHDTAGFLHILGNMLGLFFVGRMIEPILGRERFLWLYLAGTIIGGLVYLGFHFEGARPVVGASAAVFGLIGFFCLLRPEQPITLLLFFVLPITIKPKWLLRISIGISVGGMFLYELQGNSIVAHSAHLGGILSGVLFFKFVYLRSRPIFGGGPPRQSMEMPEWFKKKKQSPARREISYTVNRTNRDAVQNEVDRILDKINQSGFASLTENEKRTLDEAKDLLS